MTEASKASAESPLSSTDRALILGGLEDYVPQMNAVSRALWNKPELGYREVEASRILAGALRAEGFAVETGAAGLPTAFVATFEVAPSSGAPCGPVVAFLAEMDALPGFSQDVAPEPKPIPGQTDGHACGHNLFGAGSLGAAVALSRWAKDKGVPVRIRVYGTPAEEGGAGKAYMAREGLFDDVAVALHWHPGDKNSVWQNRSLAALGGKFRFHGKSAHAAASPETGRSALHGVEAFHHMAALLREVMPLHTHIHYVTLSGGEAPNTIPDFAESYLGVRHPDAQTAREVFTRVCKAAEGAALGTGTRLEVQPIGGIHPLLPNDTLGRLTFDMLRLAPPIVWSDEETAFALKLQESLPEKPDLAGVGKVEGYFHGEVGAFSTDVGDVSWITPCAALGTASWVPATKPHTWQAVAAGGMGIGEKGMKLAAQVLAFTAAALLRSPEILAAARAEFENARGEGVSYRSLLPEGSPPFDYRG